MLKFMKRTWDIEGLEWAGDNHWKMWEFLEKRELQYIRQKGEHFYIDHNQCKGGLVIKTPKGDRPVNLGDFVIRTINGDYITCSADLFHYAGCKLLKD